MAAFPDVRWGSEKSWLRKPLIAFSETKPGSWFIKSITPLDRKVLIRTKGRKTILGPIGAPTMLLTTIGAKSGLARTSPLLFARDGDDSIIVVGSNFGQQRHPAWSGNLIAHPDDVTVTTGGVDIPVRAELLTGADADAAYRLMEAETRTYNEYKSRTDRTIRVFRLTAKG
jgi:deazaflavin-dependent oxidoreductase (nitroreductase family)